MTVERLTRSSEVLALWPLFHEGLSELEQLVRLHYNETQAQKMLCLLAADPSHGYISVAYDDDGTELGFAIARDDTLPFSTFRTFCAHAVYYKQGHSAVVLQLMGAFEDWCRASGIRRYYVLTRRATTAAKRCFQHEKYGFRRMSFVFEKDIL